jgi:hypothetical protein
VLIDEERVGRCITIKSKFIEIIVREFEREITA